MLVSSAQKANMVHKARVVSRAPSIITSRDALTDKNCGLIIPVVKGRCARNAL